MVRPSRGRFYLIWGIVSAPLVFVPVAGSWFAYVQGTQPLWLELFGFTAPWPFVFVLWVALCGWMNHGTLLESDALYVFRSRLRTRQLTVVRVLWEDLLAAEPNEPGPSVTLSTHGPSLDLTIREARAVLLDPRYASTHPIRPEVRRLLRLPPAAGPSL